MKEAARRKNLKAEEKAKMLQIAPRWIFQKADRNLPTAFVAVTAATSDHFPHFETRENLRRCLEQRGEFCRRPMTVLVPCEATRNWY